MTFQAYIENIKTKTRKTPEDFRKLAHQKGLLQPGTKATQIYEWLIKEFSLGLGHARTIYQLLKPHIGKT